MFSGLNIAIHGGTFNNNPINGTSRGMDILMEWVATDAFHNSGGLYDAPKCHPHTRVAVLDDIMKWVGESESARQDFMLWLFGPAGAGKSAIAKRIAEIAAEMDMLIATFFFSRTSPTRNTEDRLIATLTYQLTVSIPDTRSYIEDAIERDPAIFKKNVQTQIDTLLIKPFQSISSTRVFPSQKLIIIDGLDECNDSRSQVVILEAISRSFPQQNLPIKFLVVSRPEFSLVTSFSSNEPLKSVHRRLALDDTYKPDDDIRLFFSDKFEHIKLTHPLRSIIPISWPTEEMLSTLVEKSSGQFIYASTVVKFVESSSHQPSARLKIILGISPPGKANPFAELDALYIHLLSSVDDVQLTLRVLSFYVMIPNFAGGLSSSDISPELFLSLEPGDIQLALINLSSIVTYDESYGSVRVLHASFVDFLSDTCRSTTFYIDVASTRCDFFRRILQCVKGPDGIQAGDTYLFYGISVLSPWIPKGQLRSDILSFDFDAFINASIGRLSKDCPLPSPVPILAAFDIWMTFLNKTALEDRYKKVALDRFNKSVESRLKIYQSDWRLQLLLASGVASVMYEGPPYTPYCRYVDILLEIDDHDLHLADQHGLDLRHAYIVTSSTFMDMVSCYVDGNTYASAALHFMRFLSKPPDYSKIYHFPGLTYAEWEDMYDMILEVLCTLLQRANTLPELVQFISNHDIHPAVQKKTSAERVCKVKCYILAFLSRASICPNWQIISLTQQFHVNVIKDHQSSKSDGEAEERKPTQNLTRRVDRCCWNMHHDYIKYNELEITANIYY